MSVSGAAPGIYALAPQALGALALALLMLGVFANDHHAAFALDDLAFLADGFHGRLNLHADNLLCDLGALLRAPGDAPLGEIVGRHFQCYLVSGQDADEIGPQLAGDVRQQPMAVCQLHPEGGVGQRLNNGALNFDDVFFRQALPSSWFCGVLGVERLHRRCELFVGCKAFAPQNGCGGGHMPYLFGLGPIQFTQTSVREKKHLALYSDHRKGPVFVPACF